MKLILILKIVVGFVALSLGAIGIFLPILPTTPFILLAVGCFSSTPSIQKRVLKIPFVREYHESYRERKSLSNQTVAVSLIFLWSMLLLSAVLTSDLLITSLLFVVGACVTVHILYLANRGEKLEN